MTAYSILQYCCCTTNLSNQIRCLSQLLVITQRNVPEKRTLRLNRGGNLKSCTTNFNVSPLMTDVRVTYLTPLPVYSAAPQNRVTYVTTLINFTLRKIKDFLSLLCSECGCFSRKQKRRHVEFTNHLQLVQRLHFLKQISSVILEICLVRGARNIKTFPHRAQLRPQRKFPELQTKWRITYLC